MNATKEHCEQTIFLMLLNYLFKDVEGGVGLSHFADDGAMWRRGRNLKLIIQTLRGAEVEK